ncbi:transcription termination factor 2, mitochondrial isoform X2 [Stegostoma tigrinum]|nr:transcription termination factor 2, mitochondrial isoform X2 [Stegostoma tigrinum]
MMELSNEDRLGKLRLYSLEFSKSGRCYSRLEMSRSRSVWKMFRLGLLYSGRCGEHWFPSAQCSQGTYRSCLQFTVSSAQRKENGQTVESLKQLSVDVARIRQLKSWVLLVNEAYVNETANILKEMGVEGKKVAVILERYPEAVLCKPAEIRAQQELWGRLCTNQKELARIIERFPESFFTIKNHKNRQDNIKYFQALNLNNRIINRLLVSSPQTFCSSVNQNRAVIENLQKSYLQLGGNQANMRIWLMKLLSQNAFILLKPPNLVCENLNFLRSLGFSNAELLKLFSKLKGLITELSPDIMEKSTAFCGQSLQCSDEELRIILMSCPALLYFSAPVLEERLTAILQEGFSVEQVKASPAVLELSPQIVYRRIKRLVSLGYDVKRDSLELLKGTKKDFEVNCGKMNWRKERPLFNPVAPLSIED